MIARFAIAVTCLTGYCLGQTTQNPAVGGSISPQVQAPAPSLEFLGPLKTFVTDLVTAKPVHLTGKSIAPGGGTGVGPIYTWDHPSGDWHAIFNLEGEASTRRFWTAQTRLRLLHPSFSSNTQSGDSFKLELYARTRDMPLLPFYGIGPNSSKSALTDYRERETSLGATVVNPVSRWLGIGGTIENIWPQISRPDGSKTVIALQDRYSDAFVPGIGAQPSFLRTSFFAHPYHRYPAEIDSDITYNYFHDNKNSGFSFARFSADVRYNFYPVAHGGQPRRDNVLSVHGLYELSFTNGVNRVPFYLMDTLGGSDINNSASLRGFSDMRFRAPNLLLFQTEYDKRLVSIIGMMAFYDTGRVALQPGQLTFSGFRHSFGFGGTVWLESRVMFRAYVGLGSGEGVHPFFGLASFF